MPSLASSTSFLLLLSILSILTATTAGLPVTDDGSSPAHGHLQRRDPVCVERLDENLIYGSCSLAAFRIPNSVEELFMTNDAPSDRPWHLPREFVVNECRISFSLKPEARVVKASWAILRARARAIIMQCVRASGPEQPPGSTPGRGGLDVYAGVLDIEVSHAFSWGVGVLSRE